jgi:hypothetical protein
MILLFRLGRKYLLNVPEKSSMRQVVSGSYQGSSPVHSACLSRHATARTGSNFTSNYQIHYLFKERLCKLPNRKIL